MGRDTLDIPPELKKITPYIRRAEELDQDKNNPESRLVAYYARQYAVYVGIPNSKQGGEAAKKCLGILLEQLEREKPVMDTFTRDESKFLCRKFALKVFDKADAEDRMGMASKNTAKTFYAAATFLEILAQFYPDDDDSEDRQEEKKRTVYAKWKATDILKAIKEGREPTAGGYGEQQDEEEHEAEEPETMDITPTADGTVNGAKPNSFVLVEDADDEQNGKMDVLPPPLSPPSVTAVEKDEEGYEVEHGPPPGYPGEVSDNIFVVGNSEVSAEKQASSRLKPPVTSQPKPPPPAQVYRPPIKPVSSPPRVNLQPPPAAPVSLPDTVSSFFGLSGGKKATTEVTKTQLKDAIELTRFALSALEDKDLELGVSRLQQALKTLGR
jgi:vacuolar protein sorting-associated protein VTA1